MSLNEKHYARLLRFAGRKPWRGIVLFSCCGLPWLAAVLYGLCCFLQLWRQRAIPWPMLAPVAAAFALATVLRRVLPVQRPFRRYGLTPLVPHEDGGSFPSRHSACAASLVMAVWPAAPRMAILLAVMALFIGLGRVSAALHAPRDVLGGYALGILAGIVLNPSFFGGIIG